MSSSSIKSQWSPPSSWVGLNEEEEEGNHSLSVEDVPPRVYVSVEGIVGAGKSTALHALRSVLCSEGRESLLHIYDEPLESMQSYCNGLYNPLQELYADTTSNVTAAQCVISRVVSDYYRRHLKDHVRLYGPNVAAVSERSVLSSFAFVDAYFAAGKLSCFTRDFLSMEHRWRVQDSIMPTHVILLELDPAKCNDRLEEAAGAPTKWAGFHVFQEELHRAHVVLFESLARYTSLQLHRVCLDGRESRLQVADKIRVEIESIISAEERKSEGVQQQQQQQ